MRRRDKNPKQNWRPLESLRSRRGFTLIELLVGLVISVIGVLIFSAGLVSVAKSKSFVQTSLTLNELSLMLRSAINDRKALQETIAHSPELHAVVSNDYSLVSGGTMNSNQFYDLAIYSSSGAPISGPPSQPLYYTTDGNLCANFKQGKCLISIKSTFLFQGLKEENSFGRLLPVAQYPVGPDINIDFIQINYTISFWETESDLARQDIKGSVFINFEDIGL